MALLVGVVLGSDIPATSELYRAKRELLFGNAAHRHYDFRPAIVFAVERQIHSLGTHSVGAFFGREFRWSFFKKRTPALVRGRRSMVRGRGEAPIDFQFGRHRAQDNMSSGPRLVP